MFGNNLNLSKGDTLGIADPSETELGGVCTDNDGRLVKRSRKIFRGLILMIIIALCWVSALHLFRMSFHTDRVLLAISPIAGNFNLSQHLQNRNPTVTPSSTLNNLTLPLPLEKPTPSPKVYCATLHFP